MFKRITWESPVSFYMLLCRQYLSMMQGFPCDACPRSEKLSLLLLNSSKKLVLLDHKILAPDRGRKI